ncbi:GGDEF domain-containing response regulator [Geopsychrobacter electrodiphilus]|uniref:GGDEF domain-containing response regulator n=1 Tax=Geopsychrobacter electrodiphilus TaxID=225196 RepID=UPI0003797F0C|nr:diguanylate cyclase [Geopsychrobacter electrodiphilus]
MDQATILVVDDELFFRQLYRDLLSESGHKVEVYDNGEEAISRMGVGDVDLVLTDMVMPGRCGLEVLRAARTLADPPEVILVTGHASLESAIHALKNGARDYLVKPFNPEELKHLVNTCLDQRRLLNENVQLRQQIHLFQNGQSLSSLIELDRLLPRALEVFQRELGGGYGFSFLVDDNNIYILQGVIGIERGHVDAILRLLPPFLTKGSGFKCLTSEELKLISSENRSFDSLCFLPLYSGGLLKGGLVLGDGPLAMLDQTLPYERLHYLSEQISLGFENSSRYHDAQELMYTDDLTGLYNYRYMQIALNQEARRSQRYGLNFSLIFLDLDRFKGINDRYGHLAGSAALQEIAGLLRGCVREVDTLFRFGGDEFAALLVETDTSSARVVAERIRKSIADHHFLQDRDQSCRLTTTVGYSTFPSDALDCIDLLDLADQAMYDGKRVRNVIRGVQELGHE